ncbi:MAG: phosphopentomutase, partial [Anaerotignum sp.]|nr:phosphopentomutase [Anaerotignum sp.]
DRKLPEIISLMKEGDLLFITADHGCDPTTESTDHSREYVPVLAYGKKVKEGVDLGVRKTFADLGQTISDYLELDAQFEAESFLQDILK